MRHPPQNALFTLVVAGWSACSSPTPSNDGGASSTTSSGASSSSAAPMASSSVGSSSAAGDTSSRTGASASSGTVSSSSAVPSSSSHASSSTPAPSSSAAPSDDIAALSDAFDDAATLSQWHRVHQSEQWPTDQLRVYDIGVTQAGALTMEPFASAWFRDYRGALAYKLVSGEFIATTHVRVTGHSGGVPAASYSLAGIMVRTPRNVTPATWTPGGENYIFLSVGSADNPGTPQAEVKTTVNSNSVLSISDAISGEMTIRVARVGSAFILLLRPTGGSWSVHRRYSRPDMPSELQVGMTAYTDWSAVSSMQPADYNVTLIQSAPQGPGHPDLVAHFDHFQFARPTVPAGWSGRDLVNPADVTNEELLAVFGAD